MTGVSYMLPLVVAGGLAIALAFAIGGIQEGAYPEGTLAAALMKIGGDTAFRLFIAVFSAFIAYSIADRPGIAPGLIGGFLAQSLGAGFIGGIFSGFLAGYLTKFLADKIRLPATLEGLKPVLILPFLSTLGIGLLMIYVIAPPVTWLNNTMNAWLLGMQGANAIVLGIILGAMMGFDMGGPINKAVVCFRSRPAREQDLRAHGGGDGRGHDPAAGACPGVLPLQEQIRSRRTRGRRSGPGPWDLVHHRRRDSLRREGSDSRHSGAHGRLCGCGRDLDGERSAASGSSRWHLRGVDSRRGIEPLRYVIAILAGTVVTAGVLFFLKRPDNRADARLGLIPASNEIIRNPKNRKKFDPMIQLTPQNIRIGARAANKNEAIRAAGQVLVESGFIEPGYIESMIGREGQANTYLGNGISIPHGMAKDRELIRATGISVVQLPEGVEWGPGKVAHIIVGIAAKSDEHLGVLAALTDVLDDPARAELLAKTKDPNDIIAGLSREAAESAGEPSEGVAPPPGAHHVDAKIVGSAGMHARPATMFVDIASQFESDIRVQYGIKIANGKSMAAILKLGTPCGEAIRIIAVRTGR